MDLRNLKQSTNRSIPGDWNVLLEDTASSYLEMKMAGGITAPNTIEATLLKSLHVRGSLAAITNRGAAIVVTRSRRYEGAISAACCSAPSRTGRIDGVPIVRKSGSAVEGHQISCLASGWHGNLFGGDSFSVLVSIHSINMKKKATRSAGDN